MVTCITCICSLDTPSDEVGVGSQPENLSIVLLQGVFVTRRVYIVGMANSIVRFNSQKVTSSMKGCFSSSARVRHFFPRFFEISAL